MVNRFSAPTLVGLSVLAVLGIILVLTVDKIPDGSTPMDVGRQKHRSLTSPSKIVVLPPAAAPINLKDDGKGGLTIDDCVEYRGLGQLTQTGTPSPGPGRLPLAIGARVYVPDPIEVAVRNPSPVRNSKKEYAFDDKCWVLRDTLLEPLGTVGDRTLFRIRTVEEVGEQEKLEFIGCPVGTVFFSSSEDVGRFVTYTERRDETKAWELHLKETERLRTEEERTIAEELLRKYELKSR